MATLPFTANARPQPYNTLQRHVVSGSVDWSAKDVSKLDANGNCPSNLWHVRMASGINI